MIFEKRPQTARALFAGLVLMTISHFSFAMKAPDVVVKDTIDSIVQNIQTNRSDYQQNPEQLFVMVEEVLVPMLHVDRMANLILGKKHAGLATDQQKQEFAEQFKTFLMRSYATALLQYTGDETVEYTPVEVTPDADKVAINARLISSDGQAYPVDIYMSNRRDTQWRAYNISVAGINFVSTYRATFRPVLEKDGIDGLITQLRKKNSRSAANNAA